MPQTREHLNILGLLGLTRGAVVLTKIDRVDAARRIEAEQEVRHLLSSTHLADAPLFPLSSVTGEGLEARFTTGQDLARLLWGVRRVIEEHGSLRSASCPGFTVMTPP